MDAFSGTGYYLAHRDRFLTAFDDEAIYWRISLARLSGADLAADVLREARCKFEELLACLPYIGGDDNHLTGSLVEAAGYLALYLILKKRGWMPMEAAKVMYDALLERGSPSLPAPARRLSPEQLMERRQKAAERSLERRYTGDFVYEFVPGDGLDFDYGYNFLSCASLQLYRDWDASEFAPFYCYLDFPRSTLGLRRVHTLAEGDLLCDHRFKFGRPAEFSWPPPFVKSK
jgi:hypothetical protein